MEDSNLESLFKKASEISKSVPKHLQKDAFNRALDVLLNEEKKLAGLEQDKKMFVQKHGGKRPKKILAKQTSDNIKPVSRLLESMDRTSYPQIINGPRVLERALALLRAAKDDFEIDGLGSAAIAKVLTEKFRLRTTRQAVHQALDASKDKVDRVIQSGKTYYRIMHPGEVYLDSPDAKTIVQKKSPTHKQTIKSKIKTKKKSAKVKTSTPKPGKKTSSKTKVKSLLQHLIDDGYFNKPKRIGEVREYLRHKKGHDIKVTTLSPYFTKMIRDGVLDRTRAENDQYEYKRK